MDAEAIEEVAIKNVLLSIQNIRKESPILAEMEQEASIFIVGAIYSVAAGKVSFLEKYNCFNKRIN